MEPAPRLQTSNVSTPARLSFITRFIATGAFAGYIPWASGTFGSVVGVLVYAIPGAEHYAVLSCLIVAGFAAGVITSARVAQSVGNALTPSATLSKEMFQGEPHRTPDPSIVVIDEIVGMWITLFLLPKTIWVIVIGFLLFRAFDIVKPPPARQLERIPDGWGIMLDDVAAGIYANVLLRLIAFFFPVVSGI